MTATPSVTLLGLGEAGAAIAAGLVERGVVTRAWDPDSARTVAGVERAASAAEGAAAADVVLSLNAQSAALGAASSVAEVLTARHLYADLNTTSPAVKREVGAAIAPSGAAFADVALLGPVPGKGLSTPCLASGPGAARFAEIFGGLGMPVETVGGEAGEAAARKLLRSVFMKGLAAAALESLAAASAAGQERWLRDEILAVLHDADGALLDRLLEGSHRHARRRADEMDAAAELVAELGLEPRVAAAARDLLRSLDSGV
jgi:3-hydroxyisobutyrate dehydrogenase-like beta-hydroxyacid dehydrogenase